jgi:hypothetical protein
MVVASLSGLGLSIISAIGGALFGPVAVIVGTGSGPTSLSNSSTRVGVLDSSSLGRDGSPGGVDRVQTGDRGLAGRASGGVGPLPFPGALVAVVALAVHARGLARARAGHGRMAGRPSVLRSLPLAVLAGMGLPLPLTIAASAFSN